MMKVFEHIMRQRLVSVLECHHLLSPSQSGFRNKRSAVTLLTEAVDDWSSYVFRATKYYALLTAGFCQDFRFSTTQASSSKVKFTGNA